MAEEVALLLDHMTIEKSVMHAGVQFTLGELYNHQIAICKCGVGKVNAAICTQVLIDSFAASKIIFTGVAGAVDPNLTIGDIVISIDCLQHDMDVTALGFSRGEIPYQEVSIFKSDLELGELAYRSGIDLFPEKVVFGRILSGDQFIASRDKVAELYSEYKGSCTEMEGAATAQVSTMNNVPFVIIRSMSDNADGLAPASFEQFMQTVAHNSFQIVAGLLRNLAPG